MSMRIPFLDLAPVHRELAKDLTLKFESLLQRGIFSGGEEVTQFEDRLSAYLKAPFAVSCANGSDALELALRALEIGPGDEVLVPALTWVSTAEAVAMVGAKPVFVDVDQEGLIDLGLLAGYDSPNIKAVIPVHLYGHMVHMPALMKLATRKNWKVIEDAAQAFGAFMEGKSAGTFGDLGCFSFYPTKNLGALGEAGMVICFRKDLAGKLALLRNHGQPKRDQHDIFGRNSRIDTLQAAFLNVKMDYFETWQEKRKDLSKMYWNELSGLSGVKLPEGILEAQHNAHLFAIQTADRDGLQEHLAKNGIGTAIHYPLPVPKTRAFGQLEGFPMAASVSETTLSLPLHPALTRESVSFISQTIRDYMARGFAK